MADKVITTDVLVLGGGLSGCMAGIRAREQGANVIVVDKASVKRSGESGLGIFFFTSYFSSGEPWDTAERYRNWWRDVRSGLVNMDVVENVVIKSQPAVQQFLENLGVSLRHPKTGKHTTLSRDTLRRDVEQPRFFFNGEKIKTVVSDRLRELGAQIVERIFITSLLTSDGKVVGATGFHNRNGDFYTFKAKTVVLAMGSATRIYPSATGNPFNDYRRPYNAGTGHALALRAGAEMASFEFCNPALSARWGYNVVQSVLTEAGARLVNGLGEPIVARPDGPGEWGVGCGITYDAYREINAGRGPIYLDARKVSPERIQEAIRSQVDTRFKDMPMGEEYLERTGVELAGGLVELTPYMFAANCSSSPKGAVVDRRCMSSVNGLFVVGDLSNASDAGSGAITSGFVAGAEAAKHAAATRSTEPDEVQIKEEKERAFAPLHRKGGIKWDEIEKTLRGIMFEHVGISRTALGLNNALDQLKDAEKQTKELCASNLHELMRSHEAADTLFFDKMVATAALERTETRHGYMMSHRRGDHPQTDDANWWGVAVVVKKAGDKLVASRRRVNPLEIKPK